ncbi:MAG: hypothetical protein Q9195_008453 [Heterodermia aff. obscurata]
MSSQWVDQPYALIGTTAFSKDSSHAAYYVATQMALAHNGILRGLNSIYLQATHIPREDLGTTRDFLTYCQCWGESMHHHHDAEEEVFFPSIEVISGVQGIMEHNIEQHRAFTPGFDLFQEYSRTCLPKDYDGQKIKSLIEGFAGPLTQHLHDEIGTLRDLDKYDSERIRKAYKRLEKSLMATDNYRIGPLVFGTADRSFEGGMHDFPAVPFFVPYVIHYWFARRHRGAWRFNPCTMWRDRRELAFKGLQSLRASVNDARGNSILEAEKRRTGALIPLTWNIMCSSSGIKANESDSGETLFKSQGVLHFGCWFLGLDYARAVLRDSKMLIMDEATASLGHETGIRLQETITALTCAVLTKAHRLRKVIEYDRVLVLEQGEMVEYDEP